MLNDYSHGGYNETQAQAVGALMYDLGYLARATYGVNGTICDEGKVWNTLQKYYDCNVRQLEKDILETIIFHLTKIEEQSRGVNDAKQQK